MYTCVLDIKVALTYPEAVWRAQLNTVMRSYLFNIHTRLPAAYL